MKKNIIIFSLAVLLLTILLVFAWKHENKSSVANELGKTKTIIVDSKKEISNSDDIDKIVKIILNGTEMPEGTIVPYRGGPHHRLKMLDAKGRTITEIEFYYYSDDYTWISYNNDNVLYEIDGSSLLKFIDS